jgi:hypothetical protein
MSLLSLRDVVLAYFALLFITSSTYKIKLVGLTGAFLLRPHLAVALAFGYLLSCVFLRLKPKFQNVGLCAFALISYVSGTIAYWAGSVIQKGTSFDTPKNVFSQIKFSQLAANFLGLQFLTLNNPETGLVASSTASLLLSRIVFFDTILIPVFFITAVFQHSQYLTRQKSVTLLAFVFFFGIVSQTTWNSTRQNIPFLACMGVLAVADIEHFRKIKAKVAPKLLMATR